MGWGQLERTCQARVAKSHFARRSVANSAQEYREVVVLRHRQNGAEETVSLLRAVAFLSFRRAGEGFSPSARVVVGPCRQLRNLLFAGCGERLRIQHVALQWVRTDPKDFFQNLLEKFTGAAFEVLRSLRGQRVGSVIEKLKHQGLSREVVGEGSVQVSGS